MAGDYFWECVEALAVAFVGNPQDAEHALNDHARKCMQFTPQRRAEVRRQMIKIIGGLAQLETRLADNEAL